MIKKHKVLLVFVLVGGLTFVGSLTSCKSSEVKPEQKYEPSWESLKQHSTPEWFKDAKFGIREAIVSRQLFVGLVASAVDTA